MGITACTILWWYVYFHQSAILSYMYSIASVLYLLLYIVCQITQPWHLCIYITSICFGNQNFWAGLLAPIARCLPESPRVPPSPGRLPPICKSLLSPIMGSIRHAPTHFIQHKKSHLPWGSLPGARGDPQCQCTNAPHPWRYCTYYYTLYVKLRNPDTYVYILQVYVLAIKIFEQGFWHPLPVASQSHPESYPAQGGCLLYVNLYFLPLWVLFGMLQHTLFNIKSHTYLGAACQVHGVTPSVNAPCPTPLQTPGMLIQPAIHSNQGSTMCSCAVFFQHRCANQWRHYTPPFMK